MENFYFNDQGHYLFATQINPESLPPDNATRIAPVFQKGYHPVWDGKEWTLLEDHRKKAGWLNGEAAVIKDLGPLPEGWSFEEPPFESPAIHGPDWEETPKGWLKIIFSKLDFLALFTVEEHAALIVADRSGLKPLLSVIKARLELADFISIRDPRTVEAVLVLVQERILTPERGAEVLGFESLSSVEAWLNVHEG